MKLRVTITSTIRCHANEEGHYIEKIYFFIHILYVIKCMYVQFYEMTNFYPFNESS